MSGGGGRDAVLGGDEFGPQSGDRNLAGGAGGDFVGGGKGADSLSGGPGPDYMFAGPNSEGPGDVDAIAAGTGNDAVFAGNAPAARDFINCGGGFDRALVDSEDVTTGCEKEFTSFNKFFNAISGEGYFAPLNNL